MNYAAHYERLVARARTRCLVGYCERHHVTPKCMGGDNSRDNIVRLTPEEHFVAHKLLVCMYPGDYRLLSAVVQMTGRAPNKQGPPNKITGWMRRELSIARSARARGVKRKPHSEETKAKMRAASLGRTKSPEHRAALAKAKRGTKRGPHSAEHRARLSESITAAMRTADKTFFITPQYRETQSQRMTAVWAARHAAKATAGG